MALRHAFLSFFFLTHSFAADNSSTYDYDVLQYVDTLIGTSNGGQYLSSTSSFQISYR